MKFKFFGKNRIKRIADMLEKLSVGFFSLAVANSVFLPESTKSNDQTIKAALFYSAALFVVSYF
jgi:hypothetical protein